MSCRFKKAEERTEYVAAMKTLLPLLYERMMGILADQSIPSVMLQHIILKIFYATMQASIVQCNKLAPLIGVHGIPGRSASRLLVLIVRPITYSLVCTNIK